LWVGGDAEPRIKTAFKAPVELSKILVEAPSGIGGGRVFDCEAHHGCSAWPLLLTTVIVQVALALPRLRAMFEMCTGIRLCVFVPVAALVSFEEALRISRSDRLRARSNKIICGLRQQTRILIEKLVGVSHQSRSARCEAARGGTINVVMIDIIVVCALSPTKIDLLKVKRCRR